MIMLRPLKPLYTIYSVQCVLYRERHAPRESAPGDLRVHCDSAARARAAQPAWALLRQEQDRQRTSARRRAPAQQSTAAASARRTFCFKAWRLEALRGGPARRGRCRASDERARRWRDADSERGQELAHLEHQRGSQQGRESTLAARAAALPPSAHELVHRPDANERVVTLDVHSFRGGSPRTWPAISAEASSEPPRLRERALRLSSHRVVVLDGWGSSQPRPAAQRGR